MVALALELSIRSIVISKGGGTALSGAASLLGAETNGLAFSASDDSMEIRDTVTPANNYVGSTIAKFGSVRASAAMLTGSTGLSGWGPENLALRSQEFDNAVWLKVGVVAAIPVVTANAATAPDNTSTADEVAFPAIAGPTEISILRQLIVPPSTDKYTTSVYVKAKAAGDIGKTLIAYINYSSTVYDFVACTITANWQRINTTALLTIPAASANVYITFAVAGTNYGGANQGALSVYMWGAQWERGTTVRPHLPTTTSAVYGLRRDYDPRTGSVPLYLCEEARTNLILRSDDFSVATWGKNGCTAGADAIAGPTGDVIADAVIPNVGSVSPNVTQSVTVTLAAHTLSVFAKNGTLGTNWLEIAMVAGGTWRAWFNLATGTKGSSVGTPTAYNITSLANGWYRVDLTATMTGTSCAVYLSTRNADGSLANVTGNGTSPSFYHGGSQLELGATASSYIPTTSATVTRAQDKPRIPSSSFNYPFVANTLYVKSIVDKVPTVGVQAPVLTLSEFTTSSDKIGLYRNGPDVNIFITAGGGSVGTWTPTGIFTALTYSKMAAAATLNNMNAAWNGTLGTLDTVGAHPASTATPGLMLGDDNLGTRSLNGWVAEGMQLPRRMSDAEIGTLTT